ncbi:hypothetical protein K493DRAFT_84746 [Basidiobolus meristosporus CBS 931.73]|uniref:Uncharacterized protein n=1 Tax=Basidiobolus meristosporus CBS 931.73 TaxID=1314790 RepID=A0A1Y1XIP7_9FUNG|nr:hypothetical protein K493DRAFT_84746 [Basidiobolus meristosporus CBS 931.73]|eukprot:ORX85637.1 hypothetical protein K493DRAFT_84746 [Basidiobolus meristosporus CBS 931.73]
MFKSWKKKTTTKEDQSEAKRFGLLSSKKTRSFESNRVQDIRSYSFTTPVSGKDNGVPVLPLQKANTYSSSNPVESKFSNVNTDRVQQTVVVSQNQDKLENHVPSVKKETDRLSESNVSQVLSATKESSIVSQAAVECVPDKPKSGLTSDSPEELATITQPESGVVNSLSRETEHIQDSTKPEEDSIGEKVVSMSPVPDLDTKNNDNDNDNDIDNVKDKDIATISTSQKVTDINEELDQSQITCDQDTNEDQDFVYQLDNRVQKLQRQVKDMRQYFKGLLKRDTEELVTASIKIQALARGHLVRQVIMFTSQV